MFEPRLYDETKIIIRGSHIADIIVNEAQYSDTNIIISKLYPLVAKSLDTNSRKFMNNIATFFNSKSEQIYDIAPYDRIYYNKNDQENMFKSLGITYEQVQDIMKDCFFYNIDYSPLAAKEPYVEVLMCCMRYYLLKGKRKEAELTTIYICFSGKFYASLHSNFWKFPPNKAVMDFVINNMLSDKFDLKKEGTLFGAIKKLSITYLDKYKSKICSSMSDDTFGKMIQQLRDREKSFLKNISTAYYEAIENKNYLNYETDSLDEDNFRLTSNDAATAARITEATIGVMTSQKVSAKLCNKCKNESIKSNDIKDIMESILSEPENIPKMRRVINIIICLFMADPANKNDKVGGAKFISQSLKATPNTKNPLIIEEKEIITTFLNESSTKYRNITRVATKNNYYRAILTYIVLSICEVAMK